MLRRSAATDWVELDRAADPDTFVGYLDEVARHDAVRAYKRQTFALLGLNPGDRVLDAGCGTGDDARTLASLVAPGGRVVGIDTSIVMVEEAQRRTGESGLPVEFRYGDMHRLDFADGAFDGARADRVFQHLDDPEQALSELIRVTRPGGRFVLADTDWGTLAIDGPDPETARSVLTTIAAGICNPWIGRQLYGLCRRAGLAEVAVFAGTAVITDYHQADKLFRLDQGLNRARASGAITEEAAIRWTRYLVEAEAADRFCCAVTGFIVSGRRG
jgi:ubiquinone/menaquinone biosynthesis C-methylase UbiE